MSFERKHVSQPGPLLCRTESVDPPTNELSPFPGLSMPRRAPGMAGHCRGFATGVLAIPVGSIQNPTQNSIGKYLGPYIIPTEPGICFMPVTNHAGCCSPATEALVGCSSVPLLDGLGFRV